MPKHPYRGSTIRNAIVLGEDDDAVSDSDEEAVLLDQKIRRFRPEDDERIKCEDNVKEEENDDAFDLEVKQEEDDMVLLGELIDLTADDDEEPLEPPPEVNRRWSPSPSPSEPGIIEIESSTLAAPQLDTDIKVGCCYEIEPKKRHQEVQFIVVTSFRKYQRDNHPVVIGQPYTRSRKVSHKLPRKVNEVVAVYEIVDSDLRSMQQQALIEVPLMNIIRHRHLHITNAQYPRHVGDNRQFMTTEEMLERGPLICRWKYIIHFHTLVARLEDKPCEWEISRIPATEVLKRRFKADENELRSQWRGPTYQGGSHNPPGLYNGHAAVLKERGPGQKYSFLDAFCGAGGASRGAERAGFEVKYGIDSWEKACCSWRMNFPLAECHHMDICDFIQTTANQEIRVDAVHLSPPCQVWSPAHTIASAKDDDNIDALLSCRQVLYKVRPRVFTLEQTFGLLKPDFKLFFDALILGFTDNGYSVRWKVINCANYGLPQRRNRLVIIGSCPGEPLPSFPDHTHSANGGNGTKKWTSIREALSKINDEMAESDPHHNPKYKMVPRDGVIGDPDQILPRCMTTSGGQNYHYSGQRCYTNREFALLQGFPSWHKFGDTFVKKQIGNAFPPVVVQVLYKHLQKSMHARDGFKGDSSPLVANDDAVMVDDEDEAAPPAWRGHGRRSGLSIDEAIVLD